MEGMGTMTPQIPQGISHAVIFCAVPVCPAMAEYLRPGDYIVACDAGYRNAAALNAVPDLVVGDFDSAPQPQTSGNMVVLPHVKDDTDTHYAARLLCEHGCRSVTMLGALGGARMEHTLANLHTALYLAKHGVEVLLADEHSEVRILCPGHSLILERRDWAYLSLFPLEGSLAGVEEKGVFYPLKNAVLTPDYPLGVSNEFVEPQATLSCQSGWGVVILTRADG